MTEAVVGNLELSVLEAVAPSDGTFGFEAHIPNYVRHFCIELTADITNELDEAGNGHARHPTVSRYKEGGI